MCQSSQWLASDHRILIIGLNYNACCFEAEDCHFDRSCSSHHRDGSVVRRQPQDRPGREESK
jgi:hypothetical protein